MQEKYFLAVDLHKDSAYWVVLGEADDEIVWQRNMEVSESSVDGSVADLAAHGIRIAQAVVEPVGCHLLYRKWLTAHGIEVAVDNRRASGSSSSAASRRTARIRIISRSF